MDIRRMLGAAAGVTAASAVLMAAVPAAAQAPTWSVIDPYADGAGNEVLQTANGQIVDSDETTLTVAVACTASSAQATAIGVQCYLEGADSTRYEVGDDDAAIGPADATADEEIVVPRQSYRLCVSSRALLRDGSGFLEAPLACSEPS